MRQEASLEQWKVLYEAATRIKELKPWEKFWDMDLIGICSGDEEDTVFYSILGRGGDCYGIAVYDCLKARDLKCLDIVPIKCVSARM